MCGEVVPFRAPCHVQVVTERLSPKTSPRSKVKRAQKILLLCLVLMQTLHWPGLWFTPDVWIDPEITICSNVIPGFSSDSRNQDVAMQDGWAARTGVHVESLGFLTS